MTLTTPAPRIHPTAWIDPKAELDSSVSVGAYTTIGAHVKIGANTRIAAHCVIDGHTTLGQDNQIFQFNSIGAIPQDKKYAGEPTELHIGHRNTVREFCSIHLGTAQDSQVTRIGDDNWIMTYVHIAHDCQIGSHNTFGGYVGFAGHVHVGDWVTMGSYAGAHQFTRIGSHAMAGFNSHISQDIPPYMMVDGNPLSVRGYNSEGLRRRGFSPDRIAQVKQMHKLLYRMNKTLAEAQTEITLLAKASLTKDTPADPAAIADIQRMIDFLLASTRGIAR